jgi:transglutaminase-like putative cysteine protease/tetratricopeptide (TPR) repeat protein
MKSFCRLLRLSLISSSFFLVSTALYAQAQDPWLKPAFSAQPAELLAATEKTTAKNSDTVVLLDDSSIRFDQDGKATRTYHRMYKVLTAQGAQDWSSVSVRYEPWRENKPTIQARVITPDASVHTLDPGTLVDAATNSGSRDIFSDNRVLRGPLPAVAIGAIVEHQVVVSESKNMLEFGQIYRLYVGSRVPVLHSRIVLEAPASLQLRHQVALLPDMKTDRQENAGRVTLTFDQQRMEPLEPEEVGTPGDVLLWPQIAFSTGSSWKSMAANYDRVLEEKLKAADVSQYVDAARRSSKDRAAVIESLIRQLHQNVRYTGVEFGESSIIPQPPSETLKRKYGDCKDKSTLLIAMLRAAGIPAHLALLSTGPGEDSYPDLPGLGVFDHAIVYVPGSPAYWIDATAEFSRLQDLPSADQGRLALIIRPDTDRLVLTPELPSSANRIVETREVFLAEKGPARFVETTEVHGLAEAGYRSYYRGADVAEQRKNLEGYIKNEYVSEKLSKFETSDAADMSRPFRLTIEAAEGRRAYTSLTDADLYVNIYKILQRLPNALTAEAEDEKGQDDKLLSERTKKKRKRDFVFFAPFVTEWHYRIILPLGFAVRAVPEKESYSFGPALLTTEFSSVAQDGVISGVFRFDSGKRRWSPAEVEEFREALKKWKQTSNPHFAFSLKGNMLLESGRIKDGIGEFKTLTAAHAKEAVHHVQLAYALLAAGLGESARAEARLATELEPTSSEAFRALGWILQHDLVSRRFAKGFDLKGALAAYKKALEIDSKNNEIRGDYAILLERDARGVRYAKSADLEEALAQYTQIGDKLSDYQLDDNPLYLRFYMGRYKDVITEIQKLPRTDGRNALTISALAASEGPQAALAEAAKLATQGGSRSAALTSAADQLVNMRLYEPAAVLLQASAEGSESAASAVARANMMRAVRTFDASNLDLNDPANIVRAAMGMLMDDIDPSDELLERFDSPYHRAPTERERQKHLKKSRRVWESARTSFRRSGTDLRVLRDILMTLGEISSEFDGVNTYRVRITFPGSSAETFFIARQEGKLRLIGASGEYGGIGDEVLHRLGTPQANTSRKLLDWVREEQKIVGGEDPIAGPVFPRLWTRGQQGTEAEMRLAAAALIAADDIPHVSIPILLAAQQAPPSPALAPFMDVALSRALATTERYQELVPVVGRLRQAYPDSLSAFLISTVAYQATGDLKSWEAAANERLQRLPDDPDAIRALARLYAFRGDTRAGIKALARLVDVGKAEVDDYNALAWEELFDRNITAKGLEYGQRGNMLSKDSNGALLHTMAAVYAETGKISEAREMILKAMDDWGLEQPDSASWYVFGRIAEQYGMTDAAVAAYQRVEKPDFDWQIPSSTYQLAARQLVGLQKATPPVTKAAK